MSSELFCCYLIESHEAQGSLRGRRSHSYIGFSTQPTKRLRQHNGEIAGGARETSRHENWKMAAVVSGFPSKVTALRFEWSWQHPHLSKIVNPSRLEKLMFIENRSSGNNGGTVNRLKNKRKFPNGRTMQIEVKLHVLALLLCSPPFNRLALSLHFPDEVHYETFMQFKDCSPPLHVPIYHGIKFTENRPDLIKYQLSDDADPHITSSSPSSSSAQRQNMSLEEEIFLSTQKSTKCSLCDKEMELLDLMLCSACGAPAHIMCLANKFLHKTSEISTFLLPVEGTCSQCSAVLLWEDLVRSTKKRLKNDSFQLHWTAIKLSNKSKTMPIWLQRPASSMLKGSEQSSLLMRERTEGEGEEIDLI